MLTRDQCQKIIDHAIAYAASRVQGTEVSIEASTISTSRFAQGNMTQNQAPYAAKVSLRVLANGRQARVETTDLSNAGISKAIDSAVAAAKLLPVDARMLALPTPPDAGEYLRVDRYDATTAAITAQERAALVKEIDTVARPSQLKVSGQISTGTSCIAIGNSNGLFQFHEETSAECSVTMETDSSSGWAKANSVRASDLRIQELAETAAKNAVLTREPSEVSPGKYTVVLAPSAVLDLLSFLWHDFSATSHKDKMSSLVDKLDSQVFNRVIQMSDDCSHPLQSGEPFDGEGLPRQKLQLVENGIFKSMVFGRRMAHEYNRRSTGHGLREPSPEGEMPLNIVVSGGDSSLAQMVESTENGIFVSRVWYVRLVDPASVLLTGMTRDGTFLIENGKLQCGILNLRFNVSVIELLNNILELGPAVRAAGEEGIPAVVPVMKVAAFNFTSSARH
jgi:PmbA protein